VPKDGLHPGLQCSGQRSAPFSVVQVANVPQVSKVEGNVMLALSDEDHLSPERMRNPSFIEDIWVSSSAIANDNT
jgi:hypothetical protein